MTSRSACLAAWILAACVAALVARAAPLAAAEWGDLQIRFIYDGEPPKPKKDAGGRPDESLLISSKDRGIANVIVWLNPQPGEEVPVHESYEKTAADSVTLLVKDQRFRPHVLLVRASQTLAIDNQDPRGTATEAELENNVPFVFLIPGKKKVPLVSKFRADEPVPAPVKCAVHAWMSAWLLVRQTPYMAVSDASGKLSIGNLPAGERTFAVWHERIGLLEEVTLHSQETKLDKGRLDWRIKPGANNLGIMLLKPEAFK